LERAVNFLRRAEIKNMLELGPQRRAARRYLLESLHPSPFAVFSYSLMFLSRRSDLQGTPMLHNEPDTPAGLGYREFA
jgi:hypothetical protein